MENYIAGNQTENQAHALQAQPMKPALSSSERAADILLQKLQLLLDQSRQTCDPDNAANLGPNEKSRILCAMAEAITAGVQTIAELEKAKSNARAITLKNEKARMYLSDISGR
jgi:hypothetical protein